MRPSSKKILRVDPRQPDPAALEQAVAALRRGELVVVPTETVYGLAADDRNPAALDRLYAAKGRPQQKPIALLAAGVNELARHGAALSPAARRLAARYWPGALTLVLDSPAGWMGFRIPDHPVMQALLRRWGGVLAVTSANLSGAMPATSAVEALKDVGLEADLVIDDGVSPGGVPSTVVKVDADGTLTVLREGAIPADAIRRTAEPA